MCYTIDEIKEKAFPIVKAYGISKVELKNTGICSQVFKEIISLADSHNLSKVILFGSRARGDFHEKSDIDLAVAGQNIAGFTLDVEEKTNTLLQYDVVDIANAQEELLESIGKDGIIIYEKV